MFTKRRCSLCMLALLALAPSVAPATDNVPWKRIASFDFAAETPASSQPSDVLATALSLIGRQPRTERNLARASVLLTELAQRSDTPEFAAAAAYHLARLAQMSAPGADALAVADQFVAAYRRWPGTFHGQLSLLRAAPIQGYLITDDTVARTQIDALAATAQSFTDRGVKRNLLATLAEIYYRRGWSAARAQQLTEAAVALGFDHRILAANLLAASATRAAAAGDLHAAVTHADEFLRRYPDDVRGYELRQLRAEWAASQP